MDEIIIETRFAPKSNVVAPRIIAALRFENGVMSMWMGSASNNRPLIKCNIWEHTVYELENLSCAFRIAAEGGLPKSFPVPSADCILGPIVNLWPAAVVEVGHPGIGVSAPRATFFIFTRINRLTRNRIVYVSVSACGRSDEAILEVAGAVNVAEKLYAKALELTPLYVTTEEQALPEKGDEMC